MIAIGIMVTLVFMIACGILLILDDKHMKRQMDEQMREFLAKFELDEETEIPNV